MTRSMDISRLTAIDGQVRVPALILRENAVRLPGLDRAEFAEG